VPPLVSTGLLSDCRRALRSSLPPKLDHQAGAPMLAILVFSLGLTSACFVFKTKEVQSGL